MKTITSRFYPIFTCKYMLKDYMINSLDIEFIDCQAITDGNGKIIGIKGDVEISYKSNTKTFSGEHGLNDYEIEYGFKIGVNDSLGA